MIKKDDIPKVYNQVVAARLERHVLLSGIDPHIVGNLPIASSPGSQILSDLNELNRMSTTPEASRALEQWLQNAHILLGGQAVLSDNKTQHQATTQPPEFIPDPTTSLPTITAQSSQGTSNYKPQSLEPQHQTDQFDRSRHLESGSTSPINTLAKFNSSTISQKTNNKAHRRIFFFIAIVTGCITTTYFVITKLNVTPTPVQPPQIVTVPDRPKETPVRPFCPLQMTPVLIDLSKEMSTNSPTLSRENSFFCIDVHEVTIADYRKCVDANRCDPLSKKARYSQRDKSWSALASRWCIGDDTSRDAYPANCVSWRQATTYCDYVNKGLPSNRQWIHAATGSGQRKYPWGDAMPTSFLLNACGLECAKEGRLTGLRPQPDTHSMYNEHDKWVGLSPTGSFPEGNTPTGLQDMGGNVWEWTATPAVDSNGGAPRMVICGAGWLSTNAAEIQCANLADPTDSVPDLGFRCAAR